VTRALAEAAGYRLVPAEGAALDAAPVTDCVTTPLTIAAHISAEAGQVASLAIEAAKDGRLSGRELNEIIAAVQSAKLRVDQAFDDLHRLRQARLDCAGT
jgi:hypothetical protein